MSKLPAGCWGDGCKGPESAKRVPEGQDALLEHCPDCVGGDALLAAELLDDIFTTRGFPPLADVLTANKTARRELAQTTKGSTSMKNPKYIVYKTDNEVIVCTPELEQETIALYFREKASRDIEDYDRHESAEPGVSLSPCINLS